MGPRMAQRAQYRVRLFVGVVVLLAMVLIAQALSGVPNGRTPQLGGSAAGVHIGSDTTT